MDAADKSIEENDHVKTLSILSELANQGDVEAQVKLGSFFISRYFLFKSDHEL